MRKLILVGTIFIFSAMVVNAQSITTGQTQTKKEQQTLTPADKAKLARTQTPGTENQTPQDVQQEKAKLPVNDDGIQVERLGQHGPYLDDPDFEAKKAQWIKDYPEEYKRTLK